MCTRQACGLTRVCCLHPCRSPSAPETQGPVSLDRSLGQFGFRVKWKKIDEAPLSGYDGESGAGATLKPRDMEWGLGLLLHLHIREPG